MGDSHGFGHGATVPGHVRVQWQLWPAWHPGVVICAKIAVASSAVFLLAAILLPCGPFLRWSAASLPYQDPTPEMVKRQAAELADLERTLLVHIGISVVLALASLAAFGCALRFRRKYRSIDRQFAGGEPQRRRNPSR